MSLYGTLVVLLVFINVEILVASQTKEGWAQLFFISLPLLCYSIYQFKKKPKKLVPQPVSSSVKEYLPVKKYGIVQKLRRRSKQQETIVQQTLLKEGEQPATILN